MLHDSAICRDIQHESGRISWSTDVGVKITYLLTVSDNNLRGRCRYLQPSIQDPVWGFPPVEMTV